MEENRLKQIEDMNEGSVFPDKLYRELCAAVRAANLQAGELREALYALLRFSTKPQPRDEEEQEQVVAKVAKALKSAGKLDELT